MKVIFRVEGDHGANIGMGHAVRSVALNRILSEKISGYNSVFLSRPYPEGLSLFREQGLKVVECNEVFDFCAYFKNEKADIVIIDLLGSSQELIDSIRKSGARIISLDDLHDSGVEVDVIINGILFATKELPEEYGKAKVYQGVEYIPLRDEFIDANSRPFSVSSCIRNIGIATGGNDFCRMVPTLLEALEGRLSPDVKLHICVGRAADNLEDIRELAAKAGPFSCEVYFARTEMAEFWKSMDLGLMTGGTVMFEAVSCGLPSIICTNYDHQLPAAKWFDEQGAVKSLGDFRSAVSQLEDVIKAMQPVEVRKAMSDVARSIVDGCGIERIAELVMKTE